MCERMRANITTFFVLGLWNAFVFLKKNFFFVDAWSLCFVIVFYLFWFGSNVQIISVFSLLLLEKTEIY